MMETKTTSQGIPVFAFTAYSGTGKTTFLEKLIAYMTEKAVRVGVLKHDAHCFETLLDKEGKDTWKLAQAGAVTVGIINREKAALIEYHEVSVLDMLDRMKDVDVIFLEGFHDLGFPTFSMSRSGLGKGYRISHHKAIALISDEEEEGKVWFSLDDEKGVAAFILHEMEKIKEFFPPG